MLFCFHFFYFIPSTSSKHCREMCCYLGSGCTVHSCGLGGMRLALGPSCERSYLFYTPHSTSINLKISWISKTRTGFNLLNHVLIGEEYFTKFAMAVATDKIYKWTHGVYTGYYNLADSSTVTWREKSLSGTFAHKQLLFATFVNWKTSAYRLGFRKNWRACWRNSIVLKLTE